MAKFVFTSDKTILLNPKKGTHQFENYADLGYEFNDERVKITINEYTFKKDELDELIELIKALQGQLK